MFMIKLLKGQPVIMFEGDDKNGRDFIYVDDINDFHLLCLTDDRVNNKVFDIGSGVCSSIAEVYDAVSRVLGIKTEVVKKPRLPEDPVVTTQADITAAKKLGWIPKTSLDEGLRAMADYMKGEFEKGNLA
jgi:nucleoside-diphosphate-sugar epimerase